MRARRVMAQPLGMDSLGPRPERAFFVLALSVGVWLALVTPPHDAPDEPRHLQRVWLLSEGRLALPGPGPGQGGAVPSSLFALHPVYRGGTLACRHRLEDIPDLVRSPLDPAHRTDTIRTPILYGPVGYLAPAAWIAPASWFEMDAGAVFYLARLANLGAWCLLCGLAIAIAPARRGLLATVALLPMSVFEAATISADAATNGLALVLLALTLRMATGSGAVQGRWERPAFIAVVGLLGLTQPGYTLLALLALGVPSRYFGGLPGRRRFAAIAVAVAVVVPAAWWLGVQLAGPFPFPRADPAAQAANSIRNVPVSSQGNQPATHPTTRADAASLTSSRERRTIRTARRRQGGLRRQVLREAAS